MVKEGTLEQLKSVLEFFERSSDCLTEEDSEFTPREGMFSVAQQVEHAAGTIDWFIDGMLNPQGFDLDFEKLAQPVVACTSLKAAREHFRSAIEKASRAVSGMNDLDLLQPLPEGPIMGGAPRVAVFGAISEHTAHHRGALTVYSRLLGKVPKMPYGE